MHWVTTVVIPLALALYLPLCGWGIYRGRIFTADLQLPGLETDRHALVFTPTLQGIYNFAVDISNLSFSNHGPFVLYNKTFNAPGGNLNFIDAKATAWLDIPLYASRCLQLDGDLDPPQPLKRYAFTVMQTNGVGVKGNICQLEFNDPAAFTVMDTVLCGKNLFTCMRTTFFLGCVSPANYLIPNCEICGNVKAKYYPNSDTPPPPPHIVITTQTSTQTSTHTSTQTTIATPPPTPPPTPAPTPAPTPVPTPLTTQTSTQTTTLNPNLDKICAVAWPAITVDDENVLYGNNFGQMGLYRGFDLNSQTLAAGGNQTDFYGQYCATMKGDNQGGAQNPNLPGLFDNYVNWDSEQKKRMGFPAFDCGPELVCGGDSNYNTLWINYEKDNGLSWWENNFDNVRIKQADNMWTHDFNGCILNSDDCHVYFWDENLDNSVGWSQSRETSHGWGFLELHCGVAGPNGVTIPPAPPGPLPNPPNPATTAIPTTTASTLTPPPPPHIATTTTLIHLTTLLN